MALTKCKECGAEISRKAKACPQCGAPRKKKTSIFTWIVLIIFIGVIANFIIPDKPKTTTTPISSKKVSATPASFESCYQLGYRYSKCATKSMKGLPCDPENDIIIPERCRGKEETQRGIDAGVRSVY